MIQCNILNKKVFIIVQLLLSLPKKVTYLHMFMYIPSNRWCHSFFSLQNTSHITFLLRLACAFVFSQGLLAHLVISSLSRISSWFRRLFDTRSFVKSSFLGISSPFAIMKLCKTTHVSVISFTVSFPDSHFRCNTLQTLFNFPKAPSVTMRALLCR